MLALQKEVIFQRYIYNRISQINNVYILIRNTSTKCVKKKIQTEIFIFQIACTVYSQIPHDQSSSGETVANGDYTFSWMVFHFDMFRCSKNLNCFVLYFIIRLFLATWIRNSKFHSTVLAQ